MASVDANTREAKLSVFSYERGRAGRGPMIAGLFVLVPMLLGFSTWAALAPLNSAAIAIGEIVLSSDRKNIQHLEGGLITDIFVREGQAIEKGAPLLVVQDLAERSRKEALLVQLVNTNAQIARLIAEREGANNPDFSEIAEGLGIDLAIAKRFSNTHLGVFESLLETKESASDLAVSRKLQIRREIEGLAAQLVAKEKEVALVAKELRSRRKLLARGISTEIEVNALARDEAVLEGEVGSLKANIARLEQSILDQDVEIFRSAQERTSTLLGELQQAQVSAENVRQELRTLQDRQDRSVIRAPEAGVILGMQVHTIGAVITPGSPLMEIVPNEDDLIIEAKVAPGDIDLVSPGMPAQVQLSAFKAKKVDKVAATLETISGDILTDEISGERYFLARLRVDEAELQSLPSDVKLTPGMPADVFLIAGERTMADYLLAPILDAVYRAFREE